LNYINELDIDALDQEGSTPLHHVCGRQDYECDEVAVEILHVRGYKKSLDNQPIDSRHTKIWFSLLLLLLLRYNTFTLQTDCEKKLRSTDLLSRLTLPKI
jgi:hypothetical protein